MKLSFKEDQYKFGTGKYTLDQSSQPAERQSQSFGGIKTPRNRTKKKRKVEECFFPGVKGTLLDDLRCHDNVTIIPKGAEIAIVDMDEHLPDVEWNGRVLNVNYDTLWDSFKPHDSFIKRLESKLDPPESISLAGAVQVINPEILASFHK